MAAPVGSRSPSTIRVRQCGQPSALFQTNPIYLLFYSVADNRGSNQTLTSLNTLNSPSWAELIPGFCKQDNTGLASSNSTGWNGTASHWSPDTLTIQVNGTVNFDPIGNFRWPIFSYTDTAPLSQLVTHPQVVPEAPASHSQALTLQQ